MRILPEDAIAEQVVRLDQDEEVLVTVEEARAAILRIESSADERKIAEVIQILGNWRAIKRSAKSPHHEEKQ